MTYKAPQARPTVLIAEDEALVRLCAADVLAGHGFNVVEAASAAQALSQLQARSHLDVLFTDVNMAGELDGIALARRVRARWPRSVILITSGCHRPDIDHRLGHFVPKPYEPDDVARTIRGLICQRTSLPCPAE